MSVFFLLICSFILSFTLQKSDAVSRQLVCFYLFLILPPTINTYWFTASLFKPHVIPTHCVDHMDCDYVSVFLEFSFVQESFYIYIYTHRFSRCKTHTHRCSQFDRLGAPKLEYMQMAHSLFVEQLACGFSCLIRMQQNKSDRVILNTANAC